SVRHGPTPVIIRDQHARTRVAPGDLRDIRQCGAVGGTVARAPVVGGRARVGVPEVRAPYGDVVGCRGESVDPDPVARGADEGIAVRGPLLAGREVPGGALREALLFRGAVGGVPAGPVLCLALAVTDADDRGHGALVQEILEGDQPAEGARIGA